MAAQLSPRNDSPKCYPHLPSHTMSTSEAGKAKQTRKRQRLSCVECTKRRQKCDRQIPCGLCISRGVAHLCRWEPIVVRPIPQRPPVDATQSVPDAEKIQALSSRIAVLEQMLLGQNVALPTGQASSRESSSGSGNSLTQSSNDPESLERQSARQNAMAAPSPDTTIGGPHALYDFKVQAAAVALAQLSLAPRDEYVGGGTILCALHKMGDPETWRFPFSRSASVYAASSGSSQPDMHPMAVPMRALVANMPPRAIIYSLLDTFFAARNWEFGLPEGWVRRSCNIMFSYLDRRCPGTTCRFPGICTACNEIINPHWIALLFAILALAPAPAAGVTGTDTIDHAAYFTQALTAKRLGEDILLAVPIYCMSEKYVQGATHSCIAAALLSAYLADRGRMSEAWKVVGYGMRVAQAMGLHRDPCWRKWDHMSKEEAEMRTLGWWLLWMRDRIYSFILGRPTMAPKDSFDVTVLPGLTHGDGSPNPHAPFLKAFIRLCEVIGDGADRCLGIRPPSLVDVLDVDRTFQVWLTDLPSQLQWRSDTYLSSTASPPPSRSSLHPPFSATELALQHQREMLAAYYLGGLMNMHRIYLMQPPPSPAATAGKAQRSPNPCREACITLALELVRVLVASPLTAAYLAALIPSNTTGPSEMIPQPLHLFHRAYFLFDGAVSLVGARAQTPPHPLEESCLAQLRRALRILRACAASADKQNTFDGLGETARRAVSVLEALWRAVGARAGDPHETNDNARQPPATPQQSSTSSASAPPPSGDRLQHPTSLSPSGFAVAEMSPFSTQPAESNVRACPLYDFFSPSSCPEPSTSTQAFDLGSDAVAAATVPADTAQPISNDASLPLPCPDFLAFMALLQTPDASCNPFAWSSSTASALDMHGVEPLLPMTPFDMLQFISSGGETSMNPWPSACSGDYTENEGVSGHTQYDIGH